MGGHAVDIKANQNLVEGGGKNAVTLDGGTQTKTAVTGDSSSVAALLLSEMELLLQVLLSEVSNKNSDFRNCLFHKKNYYEGTSVIIRNKSSLHQI